MKPSTAALKLDVYLPATPQEFQDGMVSREELDEMQHNPPQWLADLRRDGPHPRNVVAARLRVSNSGLARGGITDPLTTEQIAALAADPPAWLTRERETHAENKREERRLQALREEEAALGERPKAAPVKAKTPARAKAKPAKAARSKAKPATAQRRRGA
ncbi:hypothetical protein GCM10010532_050240 [Dactylosporangium siamense]|uniref:Uncharacterized protein n=2 Tax=Dactylosporangium siamense TaxID=685454 RepID=A0A919U7J7_9ACTN|nr:hypothetical protein Dsi01nite_036350 [Dactylosporangium siamense]